MNQPDETAAAGPVLAVDRRRFLELGGYDPIYFPGRIEDLDLGFRGWMAGYRGYYVPESVAYHWGFGTFASAVRHGAIATAGQPQHPDLHVEEHLRSPAAGPPALAADPTRCALLRGRPDFLTALVRPSVGPIASWRLARSWPWEIAVGREARGILSAVSSGSQFSVFGFQFSVKKTERLGIVFH